MEMRCLTVAVLTTTARGGGFSGLVTVVSWNLCGAATAAPLSRRGAELAFRHDDENPRTCL